MCSLINENNIITPTGSLHSQQPVVSTKRLHQLRLTGHSQLRAHHWRNSHTRLHLHSRLRSLFLVRYQTIYPGIMFMTPTSSSNYDTLILQRSANSSAGLYTCSIKDYYVATGRPTNLMNDTITNTDQVVTTTANTSYFSITMPRTLGNTNGEDWQGG